MTSKSIFCLGPSGTFSTRAAERLCAEYDAQVQQVDSIGEVFQAAATHPNSLALVPIENTTAGVVGMHQDLLLHYYKQQGLQIIAEVDYSIDFVLVSQTKKLSKIHFVLAHRHAIEQCQIFKLEHMPNAKAFYTKSTTEAGLLFQQSNEFQKQSNIHESELAQEKSQVTKNDGAGDLHAVNQEFATPFSDFLTKIGLSKADFLHQNVAAIIPLPFALENPEWAPYIVHQKDKVMAVQDSPNSFTRFFVLQVKKVPEYSFSKQKTSLYIETKKDQPALLYKILTPFSALGLNLAFLHSRPDLKKPWTYNFFIDFHNIPEHPEYSQVCLDVLNKQGAIKVHLLGTYNSKIKT